MIQVQMHMDEADNGYTFVFNAHDPDGGTPFPTGHGSMCNTMHRRVCVEGKDREDIFRLADKVGQLLQGFFNAVQEDIRSKVKERA